MLWLLAVVVLASLAGIGFRQGVIRVAFSLVGIVLGALLAGPLGRLVKPLLVVLGLKTPPLAWLLAPLVVFVLFSIIFKIAGLMVHQKVDVYFKYHAGDLRLALWERLSQRTGMCLALVNGAAYLILAAAVIYPFSYWTAETSAPDENPRLVKILNGRAATWIAPGSSRSPGRLIRCRKYGMSQPIWWACFTTIRCSKRDCRVTPRFSAWRSARNSKTSAATRSSLNYGRVRRRSCS